LWIIEKDKQQLMSVTVQTEPRPETKHKSPSKQERDAQRLRDFMAQQEPEDPHVQEYIDREKHFLEATAYHDNVPGSPGRGDVVAVFDSKGLDITEGVVIRNSKRRHLDPQFKKFS